MTPAAAATFDRDAHDAHPDVPRAIRQWDARRNPLLVKEARK
jgi:hypothetical protein